MPGDTAGAILELLETAGRLDVKALRKRLPQELKDVDGALEKLLREGRIARSGKGAFALIETLGMTTGELIARTDGSARVKLPNGEQVNIEPRDTRGAWHGDRVMLRVLEPMPDMKSYRGRVIEILERTQTKIAGVSRRAGDGWVLDPVDPRLPRGIPLETGDDPLEAGKIVTGELDFRSTRPKAILGTTLGSPTSPGALIDSVCTDRSLPGHFMDEVLEEAEHAAVKPVNTGDRLDARDLFTITVDPVDARDFDDAVSVSELPDGGYRLGVHIADVAFFAPPGSMVDAEARARGTSVYLPDRVIPMIPEVLSNGACSLRPDEDRLTRSVFMDFDRSGKRTDFSVRPTIIRSRRRLTYEQALDLMKGDYQGDPELQELFRVILGLNGILNRRKDERGALDLGSVEFRTRFGGDGMPEGFDPVPDDMAHGMIENFMVEANRAVADYCLWLDLPVLYRIHGDPTPDSMDRLRGKLSTFEVSLGSKGVPDPLEYAAFLRRAKDLSQWPLIRQAALRALQKAVYSPSNLGHYGLALESYMHFTSPIRRYPDLIVHQALAQYEAVGMADGDRNMNLLGELCSGLERRAAQSEWDSVELMALLYLSERRGSVFRGMVSDVKDFGVFVRLLDVPVEGFIPAPILRRAAIRLAGGGAPGMLLSVAVIEADPLQRQLTLTPVPDRSAS
jgi:ribonuclease R